MYLEHEMDTKPDMFFQEKMNWFNLKKIYFMLCCFRKTWGALRSTEKQKF